MTRSDDEDEQLTDEMIGEAALSLLNSHRAINSRALVARLEAMFLSEQDARRRKVLQKIIGEIEGGIFRASAGKTEKEARSRAGEANPPGAKNIH